MIMALSYQNLNQKYWKKFPRERMAERKRHMLALSKPCILIEIHVKKGEVLRKKVNSATFSFSNKIHTEEQIHSNLDITNKSIRPFLFTLSNNSLHISYVICWVNPKKWELIFVQYIAKFTISRFECTVYTPQKYEVCTTINFKPWFIQNPTNLNDC